MGFSTPAQVFPAPSLSLEEAQESHRVLLGLSELEEAPWQQAVSRLALLSRKETLLAPSGPTANAGLRSAPRTEWWGLRLLGRPVRWVGESPAGTAQGYFAKVACTLNF